MTIAVVLIPLLNFFIMAAFTGHRILHWRLVSFVVVINMSSLLFIVFTMFPAIAKGISYTSKFGTWMSYNLFEVNWVFAIDALTYTMLVVVLSISTLVHFYSTEYMSEDPHTPRFISYLSLFTFFMLILVTANNFVSLFLGWEGVGLCSYLLISFWFMRAQANKAAIKAMVLNRVSDLFFTVGILITFYTFKSVEFSTVFGLAPYVATSVVSILGLTVPPVTLITVLLFLGAMGKSAQVSLHTWLPDAMEGPTPVSALIHAATMVTAGVFLIIRCSPLFECVPSVLVFITGIGAGTAFLAATSGLLQNDLKRVVAYSTCSQLGYMVFVCGLSGYAVGLFHLSTHAFFKAALFLSAGAVIHAIAGEQDLRRMGGLCQLLPLTYATFFVGSLTLMGIPFLSGYYSKDLILEWVSGNRSSFAQSVYVLGVISAFFTSFYSFRLLHMTFYGVTRAARLTLQQAHELGPRMATALFFLAVGSIFFGVFSHDIFVGPGTDFWNGVTTNSSIFRGGQLSGELIDLLLKLLPLSFVMLAVALVFFIFDSFTLRVTPYAIHAVQLVSIYRFITFKWCYDVLYNRHINSPILRKAYTAIFSPVDKGLLEHFGPNGLNKTSNVVGRTLVRFQTGDVTDMAAVILLGGLLLVITASY